MIKKIIIMMMFYVTSSNAALIVDTGTPDYSSDLQVSFYQSLAMQFNLDQDYLIDSVSSYFSSGLEQNAGQLNISVYSNQAGTPGSSLFTALLSVDAQNPMSWYGLSGLDWLLQAGTYWLTLESQQEPFDILVAGGAVSPLSQYQYSDAGGNWISYSQLAAGLRIGGEVFAVSVPEAPVSLLFITGLIGLCATRGRVQRER